MRALIRTLSLCFALTLALAPAAVSLAQEQPDADAVDIDDERATSFRAVEGAVTEDVPGGALMVAAYAAVWILVFGYIYRLGAMSARTSADVERLSRSLETASNTGGAGEGDDDDEG